MFEMLTALIISCFTFVVLGNVANHLYGLRSASITPRPSTGSVLDPGNESGCLLEPESGTYSMANNLPPTHCWIRPKNGPATINGVGTIPEGGIALLVADSPSSWSGKIMDASGADTFATMLATNFPNIVLPAGYSAYTDATGYDSLLGAWLSSRKSGDDSVFVGVPLSSFREVTSGGDPGDASANGGVLASDTTPVYLGDAAEALCVQWAAGNSDIIAAQMSLPAIDAAASVSVDLLVRAAGATNAPSFSVLTNWNGGAQVTDTAAGAASASIQTVTAVVAAADVPTSAWSLSMQLVPGVHATDAWDLLGVRVRAQKANLAV
jgi:hypothetical protein